MSVKPLKPSVHAGCSGFAGPTEYLFNYLSNFRGDLTMRAALRAVGCATDGRTGRRQSTESTMCFGKA